MKCKNCGAMLDEGALFCRKCGSAAPAAPEPNRTILSRLHLSAWKERIRRILKNKRLLMMIGAAAAILLVLILIIATAASCSAKKTDFASPEEVAAAAVKALEKGDGERLRTLAAVSEPLLGAHPEQFGEGDSPKAVMQGYYAGLSNDLYSLLIERYGKRASLDAETTTRILSGTDVFEANRALGIEAEEYAIVSGPLSVDGETIKDLYLVAANQSGRWKLIVLYLSDPENGTE